MSSVSRRAAWVSSFEAVVMGAIVVRDSASFGG